MITSKYQLLFKAALFSALSFNAEFSNATLLERTTDLLEESERFHRGACKVVLLMKRKDEIATKTLEQVIPLLGNLLGLKRDLIKSLEVFIPHGQKQYNLINLMGEDIEHEDRKTAIELLAINTISELKRRKPSKIKEGELQLIDILRAEILKVLS